MCRGLVDDCAGMRVCFLVQCTRAGSLILVFCPLVCKSVRWSLLCLSVCLSVCLQTSTTATYMLYALARHPEVQRRLREEVLSVVGPTALPTSKQLQELHYAKSIITETLRCVCVHVMCVHVGVCMWCVSGLV